MVVPIMLLFVFYCPPTKVYWENIFIIQARWFMKINIFTILWTIFAGIYWFNIFLAKKIRTRVPQKNYNMIMIGTLLSQIIILALSSLNFESQVHNSYQWTGVGFYANFWLELFTYLAIFPIVFHFIKNPKTVLSPTDGNKNKSRLATISLIILVLPPFWITFYQPLATDAPNSDVELPTTIKYLNGIPVPFQGTTVYPSFELQSPISHKYLNLNGIWKIKDMGESPLDSLAPRTTEILNKFTSEGYTEIDFDDSDWEEFPVPKSYINEGDGKKYGVLWYRKTFDVTESYANNALLLKFIAVNYLCDIWLDGKYLGYHEGSYYPFAFDITDQLSIGTHVLAVRVDNPMNNPLFAKRIVPEGGDSFFFEGLVRDVYIEVATRATINRVDYRITNLTTENNQTATIEMDTNIVIRVPENFENREALLYIGTYPLIFADNSSLSSQNTWEFLDWQSPADSTINKTITLSRVEGTNYAAYQYHLIYENVKLWSTKHPNLYGLIINLSVEDASVNFDMFCTQIGFRTIEVVGESLLLNNAPVILAGLTYVEMRAAPLGISLSFQDYFDDFILMNKTYTNYLRTGNLHPQAYLLADRFGITIWEESPFNWFNDINYFMCFSRNMVDAIWTEIIFRIMNRPSVIYYGACNEPWSTIGLFKYLPYMTAWIAKYDPTRILSFSAASSQDWNPAFNYLPSVTPNTYGGTFEGERYAWDIEIAKSLKNWGDRNPGKPIVIMEWGYWREGGTDERQVECFTEGLKAFQQNPRVKGFVWFSGFDYYTLDYYNGMGIYDTTRQLVSPHLLAVMQTSYQNITQTNL
jgi:beta-glucuronidase